MDLSIKNKELNKALGRTVLTCDVSFDKAMPSRKELREAICAATGIEPALLVILSANGSFGSQRGIVVAHTYSSKETAAVAKKHLLVRDGLAQKEKKAAKKSAPAAKK